MKVQLDKKITSKLLVVIAFIVTVVALVSSNSNLEKHVLEVGQIAPQDYYAPFQMENSIATARKKALAEETVSDIYVLNPLILEDAVSKINRLFDMIYEEKAKIKKSPEVLDSKGEVQIRNSKTPLKQISNIDELKLKSPISLTEETFKILLDATEVDLEKIKKEILSATQEMLEIGVDIKDDVALSIRSMLEKTELTTSEQAIAYEVMIFVVQPNRVLDEAATMEAKKKVSDSVAPTTVLKGERIISRGSRLTEESYALLVKAGYVETDTSYNSTQYLGWVLLAIMIGVLFYCYWRSKKYFKGLSTQEMCFMFMVYVTSIVLLVGMKNWPMIYVPLSLGTLLLGILLKKEVAIMMHVLIIIVGSIIFKEEVLFSAYALFSGILSIFIIGDMKDRKQAVINAIILGVLHSCIYAALKLSLGMPLDETMILHMMQIFIIGVIQVIVVIGSVPLWEAVFGFVTPIQLLELTNPNQPLLKKMLIEATGTYYHSLLIANLAEAAADEIGANPLLTRVGGYYHDIGKLAKSNYFKENQVIENPHDYMQAYESAQIILGHVIDGERIAKENKLPQCIIDIINQHHGDAYVQYFYVKAKEIDSNADIKDFTYKGPKPQTKEAALVMLADVVEATVRSMQHKLGQDLTIEDIVRKMVKQKLDEGQLDECPLYISDIDKIVKSYSKMLKGMYHERIEYPEKK